MCSDDVSDGVLGGYGKLTPEDTRGSNLFLDQLSLKFPALKFDNVADCGMLLDNLLLQCNVHRRWYWQSDKAPSASSVSTRRSY